MATHDQIEEYLLKVQETISLAEEQLSQMKQVQQHNPVEYTAAQQELEDLNLQLDSIMRSATPEQRDQLGRAQQQVRETQNHMILGF